MKKAAVIMGSDSDLPAAEPAIRRLKSLDIPYEARILSAHRSPEKTAEFAKNAARDGFGVLIAAAGKAAHLAGALAAHTILPVIGIPVQSSPFGGLDALLSTAQMPAGVPVAAVAVDGAENAAILAAQILALADGPLTEKLSVMKTEMAAQIKEKDRRLQEKWGRN
jgi:5-(carboxyamino)imidazole ribonucleotide mutase